MIWPFKSRTEAQEIEASMRSVCGRLCDAMPDQPRLKTIAAVGAYDGEIGGRGTDSRRLTQIMTYLMRSGVAIDPSFEVDVINFREKRNFLREDKKADLVYIAFILAKTYHDTVPYNDGLHRKACYEDFRSVFGLALSPDHSQENWQKRIAACDAKMIATFGGADEIGTHSLCNGTEDGLKVLIDTPNHSFMKHGQALSGDPKKGGYVLKTYTSLAKLYNNAANDLPLPWLGFAAAPGYIKAAGPFLFEETTLGRNARALALTLV